MSRLLTLCFTLSLSMAAKASDNRLFIPIDDIKAEKITSYNVPEISIQKYYSSRSRIVKVNTDLLISGAEEIVLNAFEDVELEVIPEEIDRTDSFGSIVWHGNQKYWSDITVHRDRGNGFSAEEERKEEIGKYTIMTFYLYPWDVNRESGEVNPSVNSTIGTFERVPSIGENEEKTGSSKINKRAFFTVDGSFNVLGKGAFSVKPLKHTPKYHLVYELDPRKSIGQGDVQGKELSLIKQERIKAQKDFMTNLPPPDNSRKVVEEIE